MMGEAKRRAPAKRAELEKDLERVVEMRRTLADMHVRYSEVLTPPLEGGRRLDVLDGESEPLLELIEMQLRRQLEGGEPTKEELELGVKVWGEGILPERLRPYYRKFKQLP